MFMCLFSPGKKLAPDFGPAYAACVEKVSKDLKTSQKGVKISVRSAPRMTGRRSHWTERGEDNITYFYVWPLWCGGVLGGNDQNRAEKQIVVLTWFQPVTWSSGHLGRRFGDFFDTFLTLQAGRPGKTLLRLLGDFVARGCGDSCAWGITIAKLIQCRKSICGTYIQGDPQDPLLKCPEFVFPRFVLLCGVS